MPSGAKKRKAAKKKIRSKNINVNNQSGGQSQVANDDPSSPHERESDGGEFEREEKKEIAGDTHAVSSQEEDAADISKQASEAKPEDRIALEKENGHGESRVSSSSSSSSHSSDEEEEEVAVEKEKSVVVEFEESEETSEGRKEAVKPSDYLPEEAALGVESEPREEIVKHHFPEEAAHGVGGGTSVEEKNTAEDSVKEALPVLQEANVITQSTLVENLVDLGAINSEFKEKGVEALQESDEKEIISSVVTDSPPEKTESTEIPVGEETSGNSFTTTGLSENESEDKLPKSSDAPVVETSHGMGNDKDLSTNKQAEDQVDAPAVETSREMDNGKYPNTQKQAVDQVDAPVAFANNGVKHVKEPCEHSEDQPLITSTPLSVRRTSVLGCCGLFEAFKGSNR